MCAGILHEAFDFLNCHGLRKKMAVSLGYDFNFV